MFLLPQRSRARDNTNMRHCTVKLIHLAALAAVLCSFAKAAEEARAVSAQGRIEPEGGVVKVAAPFVFSAPQVITQRHFKTGDVVTKGQVLATLDSHDRLQAAIAAARADLKVAESRHIQAQTRQRAGEIEAAADAVTGAEADLAYAEHELQRSSQLDQKAAVARMEIDKWQTEVVAKRAQLQKLQHTHAAVRDTLAAEVATAAAAVDAARAAVLRAEAEAAFGEVRAPCDGVVLKALLHAGELATSPILELGDTRTMYVIAEVYETDVRFVKAGAPASVTSQSLAAPQTGKVVGIGLRVSKRDAFNADPSARTDGRIVDVKIRLDDPQPVAGLTNLEVEVIIKSGG
jgi:HlyD family secretion protein